MQEVHLSKEVIAEFNSMYIFRKYLGKGASSTVLEAQCKENYEHVALKIIDKAKYGPKQINSLKSEIDILQGLNHPNIIQLLHVKETDIALYIATEIMSGGSLAHWISSNCEANKIITEEECSTVVTSILKGVEAIHNMGIFHRDLKPDNIMLLGGDNKSLLKIADFGLSDKTTINFAEHCGTPIYMAPELMNRKVYSNSVDVWAIGIIMYELLTNHHPYYNKGDDIEAIRHKVNTITIALPNSFSPQAKSLLTKLTTKNPEDRYTVYQALLHPWITRKLNEEAPLTIYEINKIQSSKSKIMQLIRAMLFIAKTTKSTKKSQEYYSSLLNGTAIKKNKFESDKIMYLNYNQASDHTISSDLIYNKRITNSSVNKFTPAKKPRKPSEERLNSNLLSYITPQKKHSSAYNVQKALYSLNASMCVNNCKLPQLFNQNKNHSFFVTNIQNKKYNSLKRNKESYNNNLSLISPGFGTIVSKRNESDAIINQKELHNHTGAQFSNKYNQYRRGYTPITQLRKIIH